MLAFDDDLRTAVNRRIWRNRFREPNVSADHRIVPDHRIATENRTPSVNDDIVLYGWVTTYAGELFVDKFGIKKMWCISFGFLAVSFILYAIHEKLNLGNWVPLFAIFLYQLTYGFGGGPIPWYVGPRYLPDSVRPQGSLINGCSMYSFCTLLTFVFPVMREKMQMFGLFVFYAALSLISCIIGGIFLYEPLSREELNKLDNEDELSEDDEANMQENNNKLENETI